jgi:hypothetical protein
MSQAATPDSKTQLTGPRLTLARTLWWVAIVVLVGLYLFNLPLQFARGQIMCSGPACTSDQLSPADFAQLQSLGLSLGFYAGYLVAVSATLFLACLAVAGLIFWRKSDDAFGIFTSLTLVQLGFTLAMQLVAFPPPVVGAYPALRLPINLLIVTGNIDVFVFFYLFPDGRLAPRWIWLLVPAVFAYEVLFAFWPNLLGDVDWFFWLMILSAILAQIYRYRKVSNLVQRQQTKWVVFGSMVTGILYVGINAYVSLALQNKLGGGGFILLTITAVELTNAFIPLSIGMAILRSHLWDIDILIRRTLIYGVLTALLALVYLGAVIALQAVFTAVTGSARSELVTVLSTLVIAALFFPLRRRVQAFIDRRFYRRKYDAATTLAVFGTNLRDEVNLEDLSAHLLDAVDETMQPASVSLWLPAARGGGQPK